MAEQVSSIIDIFRSHAFERPNDVIYRFLGDGDTGEKSLTFAELELEAGRIAQAIRRHAEPGDRVLILVPPGLDYIKAFFACLYAGVVAVPTYPPTNERNGHRVHAMALDADTRMGLTTAELHPRIEAFLELPAWLLVDRLPPSDGEWQPFDCSTQDLAFLQYTSGSTGDPKGVMLTHGNLLHNIRLSGHAFGVSKSSVNVSWLPPYHDMGLIGSVLSPILHGVQTILLSPAAFVQRPFRWLKAISDFRATHSGGPNFAYDLCVRKINAEQRYQIDLSCWEVAFNGAEPIRSDTLNAFADAFAACGFKRQALFPCYGLAEATLMVTGGGKARGPVVKRIRSDMLQRHIVVAASGDDADAHDCIGCGGAILDGQVRIVDPESRALCQDNEIGEIWVSGASVAAGYWGKQEQTQAVFKAEIKGHGDATWLRTGDLGFFSDGELFVTGRRKDLIILNGRNVYPQDLEADSFRSHACLRADAAAAFGMDIDGREELVLVQELDFRQKPDPADVLAAIRASLDIQPYSVVLVRPGSIPRTSSGKIRRHESKRLYAQGSLPVVAECRRGDDLTQALPLDEPPLFTQASGPMAPPHFSQAVIGEWVAERIRRRLGRQLGPLSHDTSFLALGMTSVDAVELSAELELWLGRRLSPTLAWRYPTITELSRHLASDGAGPKVAGDDDGHAGMAALDALSDDALARLVLKEIELARHLLQKVAP